MSERRDRADDERPGGALGPEGGDDQAQDEEAHDHAPPAVDRLQPGGGVAHAGMTWPLHSGQSGQPMPEPVLRTMTPMTTIT